jgi:hypothetical protein
MPQLKVKMNGKEWDSGVGRDDTYGKCGRKKGKLRDRNQQQQKGCLVDWEAESSMQCDSLPLLDGWSWLRNIRARPGRG